MANGEPRDYKRHIETSGGTGSMLQSSAGILPDLNQEAAPVRKQIGKAKQNKKKAK